MGVLLAALVGLLFLPTAQAHVEGAGELFERAEIVLAPYQEAPAVTVDGVVENGEYGPYGVWMDMDSGFGLDFVRDNRSIYVALSNPGAGWVAIGFSSDLDEGMGFAIVGLTNGTLAAIEMTAANVSDEMTLAPVSSPGDAIEAFNVSTVGGKTTAEVQLLLASGLWTIEPGVLVPTVVAFNETTADLPTAISGMEVHFLRTYPLRAQDDPAEIARLFAADISPIPGLIAVAVMAAGIGAIAVSFVRHKEGA